MKLKQTVYITLFILLGIMVSIIIHALIELPILALLNYDFDTFGLGLTWLQWTLLHNALAMILAVSGAAAGYIEGAYWWKYIYIDRKRKSTFFDNIATGPIKSKRKQKRRR